MVNALAPGQFFEAGNQVQGTALTPQGKSGFRGLLAASNWKMTFHRHLHIIIALAFLKCMTALFSRVYIRMCVCAHVHAYIGHVRSITECSLHYSGKTVHVTYMSWSRIFAPSQADSRNLSSLKATYKFFCQQWNGVFIRNIRNIRPEVTWKRL